MTTATTTTTTTTRIDLALSAPLNTFYTIDKSGVDAAALLRAEEHELLHVPRGTCDFPDQHIEHKRFLDAFTTNERPFLLFFAAIKAACSVLISPSS